MLRSAPHTRRGALLIRGPSRGVGPGRGAPPSALHRVRDTKFVACAPLCIWSHSSQLALATHPARRDNLANQLTKRLKFTRILFAKPVSTFAEYAPGSAHEIRHFLRAPVAAAMRPMHDEEIPVDVAPGRKVAEEGTGTERQKQNAKLWADAAKVTLSDPARHGGKTSATS
jgi:hypothetical protein